LLFEKEATTVFIENRSRFFLFQISQNKKPQNIILRFIF